VVYAVSQHNRASASGQRPQQSTAMTNLLLWLEEAPFSVWVREWPSILGFPFILFLHTLGLAMLAGVSVAVDLWLLRMTVFGDATRMTGLIRTMWLGFGINTVSGVALLAAYPAKALTNPVFYAKMGLVVLGVYAVTRINREVFPNGLAAPGAAVTATAKRWAIGSLGIWAATVVTGRLLAYTHRVLFAFQLQ
jgi:hypothetical protein